MKERILGFLDGHKFALWTALVYTAVVIILSCFHEVWRDEMIPFNIAIDATSPADLGAKIINYGHCALWYYVLYFAYSLCHSTVVLKVANIFICALSIYLFAKHAPFTRLQKVLFTAGVLPLYVYPVVNRDYGLTMLVIFLFCMFYDKRFTRPVMLGIILFLLANVVAYSLVMSIVILGALVYEFVFSTEARRQWMQKPLPVSIGFGLVVLGIVVSIRTLMTDYTFIVVRPPITVETAAVAVIKSVLMPERAYPTLFGFDNGLFIKLTTWAFVLYVWRRSINLFLIGVGSFFALALLFHLVWPTTALRHQGAFFLTLMMTMWLDRLVGPREERPLGIRPLEEFRQGIGRHKNSILTFVLVLQVFAAYPEIKKDIQGDFSASRKLAEYIKHDPSLKEAIVIPEPDTFGEAFSYYVNNPVYFPREDQYRKYARFTNESRHWYSMEELLATAEKIKRETGKPVLLVFGHQLSERGPFLIQFSAMTRKVFTYTPESFHEFEARTKKLASFRPAITDEEFELYLLK